VFFKKTFNYFKHLPIFIINKIKKVVQLGTKKSRLIEDILLQHLNDNGVKKNIIL